jgi:uncharacterized protein (DUF697 family)
MSPRVERLIRRTSILTAALGVVLSPLPLVDELFFLPIYGVLTSRIAKDHHLLFRQVPWKPICATALAGLAARAAVNLTVSYVPGVAAAASAASAVALTQFFGHYVDGACAHPNDAKPLGVQEVVNHIRSSKKVPPAAPVGATS